MWPCPLAVPSPHKHKHPTSTPTLSAHLLQLGHQCALPPQLLAARVLDLGLERCSALRQAVRLAPQLRQPLLLCPDLALQCLQPGRVVGAHLRTTREWCGQHCVSCTMCRRGVEPQALSVSGQLRRRTGLPSTLGPSAASCQPGAVRGLPYRGGCLQLAKPLLQVLCLGEGRLCLHARLQRAEQHSGIVCALRLKLPG